MGSARRTLQHTPCNTRHATCTLQHTTCTLQHAPCNSQHARYHACEPDATCNKQHETCAPHSSTKQYVAHAVQRLRRDFSVRAHDGVPPPPSSLTVCDRRSLQLNCGFGYFAVLAADACATAAVPHRPDSQLHFEANGAAACRLGHTGRCGRYGCCWDRATALGKYSHRTGPLQLQKPKAAAGCAALQTGYNVLQRIVP